VKDALQNRMKKTKIASFSPDQFKEISKEGVSLMVVIDFFKRFGARISSQ
jgi:hypothetical protein